MQCAGQGAEFLAVRVSSILPSQEFFVSRDKLKILVENIGPAFSTNPFNSSHKTKNPWFSRMDDKLTTRNSAPWPAHSIHWRLATEGWIPAYSKKARINFVPSIVLTSFRGKKIVSAISHSFVVP